MSDPFVMFRLNGHTALVTGASSGLGEHFAYTLAAAGARVVVAARRRGRLDSLVESIQAQGGVAQAETMDVADEQSVAAAFERMAASDYLPDIVVNNAGTSVFKPSLQQTTADWDAVVDINLRGAWLVACEAARRLLAANRGGSIVNIASILAERVAGGVAPYAASKAGLVQLTRSLALEWARHRIRVNAIEPGYLATDLNRDFLASEAGERMRLRIPQRRFGTPDELDGPLLLLASSAGSLLTGTVIAADGGHLSSTL